LDAELSNVSLPEHVLNCRDVNCKKHASEIYLFYDNIINACLKASSVLPNTQKSTKSSKKILPGWNSHCKKKKETALFWHNIWKCSGRSNKGQIALLRRKTRAEYHAAVKYVKQNESKIRSEEMATAIKQNRNRNFWKEVKKFRGNSRPSPHLVDGATGDNGISNVFAKKFDKVFNSVHCDPNELDKTRISINKDANNMSADNINGSLIDVSDIIDIVNSLKSGKSDGNVGIYSDHFIHGTMTLYYNICLLFNAMLIHAVSPQDMLVGTMVPIPKGRRLNLSCSDNFRGICLQSVLCKILDLFMLKREKDVLSTSFSQFGFKEYISANMATAVVTETIDYYQNNGGNVFVLALDATKAFDRVNFNKLFSVLQTRGLNPLYTRLLFDMYINQMVRVRYNNTYSDYFHVSNGVKQGGVISPTLFTCYIDGMLQKLKDSGLGCHMGDQYTGCVSYADDLILLAPTLSALRGMIAICEDYALEYKIKFNGAKSQLLIFDNLALKHETKVYVCGEKVEQVKSLKYLGHHLIDDRQDPHIQHIKNDFIIKVNSVLGDFSDVSSTIRFDLFNTYCMSLYGSHICDLNDKNMSSLYTEWRRSFKRVWKIPPRTHTRYLCHIARTMPPDVILKQRFINFFYSCLNSINPLLRKICMNAVCSRSIMGRNITTIFNEIGLHICSLHLYNPKYVCHAIAKHWWTQCNDDDVKIGNQIRELIDIRDSPSSFVLTEAECQYMLAFLCTE
jgi:hypothetical protein